MKSLTSFGTEATQATGIKSKTTKNTMSIATFFFIPTKTDISDDTKPLKLVCCFKFSSSG